MKVFVVDGLGSHRIANRPKPAPWLREVLVGVDAVGICGSGLKMVVGRRDPNFCRYPVVLGYE